MPNPNIELNKELLAILGRDCPRELALNQIIGDARKLFEQKYGDLNNAIGIFGRYTITISTIEGDIKSDDLIENLGENFARLGFVAITGVGIFVKKGKKVTKCSYLKKAIEKMVEDSPEHLCDYSRCLASIPPNAFFILTSDRSTSEQEEEEFLRDRFKDKSHCFCGLFLQDIPNHCDKLISEKGYYLCESKDFVLCKKYDCSFIKQGNIPAGQMEKFVKTSFVKLLISKSWKIIPSIINGLLKKSK